MKTFSCIKCEETFELDVNARLLAFVKPRYCFKCVKIEQKNYEDVKSSEELSERIALSRIGMRALDSVKKTKKVFPWQTTALSFVKKYNDPNQQKLPYLWGGVGTGKTHIAVMIAYKVMKDFRRQVLFSTASELIRKSVEDKRLFNQFKEAYHPVIIDDLGNHSITQWTIEKLYDLINHRLNYNLPTVFTSNFNPIALGDRLTGSAKETVDDVICKAITDRLLELCELIKINGESVRKLMFKESLEKKKG